MKLNRITIAICFLLAFVNQAQTQNWTKISGISDSSNISDLALINNKVVISGTKHGSPTTGTFFTSNDGGNTWSSLATLSYSAGYMDPLPINNIFTTYPAIGGSQSQQLTASTWSNFSDRFKFAEFSNGEIIGGSYNLDSVYHISNTGIVGSTINSSKMSFGIRGDYCNASNNRLFFLLNSPSVIGSDFSYIDYSDLSSFKVPVSLDGNPMTATNWKEDVSVTGMIKMDNGDLIACSYDRVLIKSVDNGINWTTLSATSLTPDKKLYKNSLGHIYGIAGGEVVFSIDGGITFTNITGNLTVYGVRSQLLVNSLNEVFVVLNYIYNETNATYSGIYKLDGVGATLENLTAIPQFELFPNPATNNLTFRNKSNSQATVSIVNLLGCQVINFSTKDNSTNIDISNQASGIYFLQATINGQTQTQKFIIQ